MARKPKTKTADETIEGDVNIESDLTIDELMAETVTTVAKPKKAIAPKKKADVQAA